MATEEYVVVRMEEPDKRVLGGPASIGAAASSVTDVSVEKHTLGSAQVADLSKEPGIVAAKKMPVSLVKPFEAGTPAAGASAVATWGLEAVGATTSRRTGAGVTVAVLDTGINAGHEAFQGKDIEQKDFTGEGDGDQNGHGTHCAGTIFGGTVGGKRIGVAPGVKKALIGKVLDRRGSGSTDQIIDGMIWAARSGANVISMSLGLDFPGLVKRLVEQQGFAVEEATSMALEAYRQNVRLFDSVAALVRAHSAMFSNCIIIAAAGNESDRPRMAIAAAPPSASDGILAVGALGRSNGPASGLVIAKFSNSGPDVSGPGVDIESAAHNSNGGLRTLSGTSMATPHVAGVAALWMEEIAADNPVFSIGELEANILARAVKNVFAGGVAAGDRGAGLVRAPQP